MDRDERIHRWLDGELDDAERARFEADLESDALLKGEVEAVRRLGSLLRSHLPAERAPEPVGEFHAGISRRIGIGAPTDTAVGDEPPGAEPVPIPGAVEVPAGTGSGRLVRFPVAWAVAAAACLVAAFLVWRQGGGSATGAGAGPEIVDAYAPDPRVHAEVFLDEETGATVILLDGLDEVPDEREVKPYSVASYGARGHAPVLFAANEAARPLFVLMPGPDGRPAIRELEGK